MKLLVLMAIALISIVQLQAQQDRYNWRFGLGVGNQYSLGNPYNADSITSTDVVELDPTFFSYSAFLELSLSKSFGLKLFANTRPQDYLITNSGLLLTYYFDNDYLFGSKAVVAPYLSLGAAYGETQNSFNVPFGGGLKFRVSSRINLNVDFTARSYTDRWSESNFDFGNELGGYSSVSLHYNFGKKPTAYNAPKPYVSPYPQTQTVSQKVKSDPPVIVEKEVVIIKSVVDTTETGTSETVQIDTNITLQMDSRSFMSAPKDSAEKAEFLNRYGKILKAPKLGDSTKALNFEVVNSYGTTAVLPGTSKSDSMAQGSDIAKTSSPGQVTSAPKVYAERDSTLAQLEFEIKRQKLKNELKLLRKAENDSILKAVQRENELLKSQLQAGTQGSNTSQQAQQPKAQPSEVTRVSAPQTSSYTPSSSGAGSTYSGSSYEPTPATSGVGTTAAGGAVVGGAVVSTSENDAVERLEAKLDTLQRQFINLQKILLAQNLKPVVAVSKPDTAVADTSAAIPLDTLGLDSLGTDTLALDSIGLSEPNLPKDTMATEPIARDTVDYVTEKELKTLKQDLAKTQQEVDSLMKVKPPVPETPQTPVKEAPAVKKTIFETTGKAEVFFDIGSSSLNAASRKKLDDMIEYAKNRPEANFLLKGFTDKTGSLAINKALSDKRAKAVEQYITSKGIATERLKVMSIGPDQSLTDGSQSYGRRVEVILN